MVKAVVGRKTRRKSTRRKSRQQSRINIKSIVYSLSLLSLLCFSIGVLTYVIFFRMVVAAESDTSIGTPTDSVQLRALEAGVQSTFKQDALIDLPMIAIIIDDMGYSRKIGEGLIGLPSHLSFSFLPHAPFTAELENMAFLQGKTIMLHLPLEPKDNSKEPGPGTLYLKDLDLQSQVFYQNLKMVPHAIGINNHMGSLYTESERGMRTLLSLIASQKLFFVDSFTSPSSRGFELAQEMGICSGRRSLFLDNIQERGEICKQLKKLAQVAKDKKNAIGIAHPYQETLIALTSCMHKVEQVAQLVSVERIVQ